MGTIALMEGTRHPKGVHVDIRTVAHVDSLDGGTGVP